MILKILALVDIHTLFVYIFHDYLPLIYIFAGASFPFLKGLIFYLSSRDIFSLIDMIIGVLALFFLGSGLFGFIWWIVIIYLIYKIVMSFISF